MSERVSMLEYFALTQKREAADQLQKEERRKAYDEYLANEVSIHININIHLQIDIGTSLWINVGINISVYIEINIGRHVEI